MSPRTEYDVPGGRLEERFPDKVPPMTSWEAKLEANRCLYCNDAPCIPACPTHVDIPTFIRKISTGNLRGSARTILKANLLGASCARVCPVEVLCEGSCVYVGWGQRPIAIGRLQRYAMEHGAAGDLLPRSAPTGRSVGLVGAGPASLACAGTLALLGHGTVIYEKRRLPGGLNATGAAPYKLRVPDALAEVAFIRELGADIRCGVEVGRDLAAEELLERHDAVFLGPGLGKDGRLGVPGEEGAGVAGATEWIAGLKTDPNHAVEGVTRAVVVGGGNSAVDAARELAGLGVTDVTLVYRRSRAEMKAYDHELSAARSEGVILVTDAVVGEILRDGPRVTGVRILRAEGGRATRQELGILPADLVIVAIGQEKARRLASLFPGVTCDDSGRIVVDPATGVTGNPRIFAGGDAVNGGKEVVHAVAEGQIAARGIDAYLKSSPIA